MADADRSVFIYLVLLCVGIVLATVLIIIMFVSPRIFVYSVLTYILAYCIYIAAYVVQNRSLLRQQEPNGNTRYNVCVYITLFNIFFMTSLFVVHVVFQLARRANKFAGSSTAPGSYASRYGYSSKY